jgi:hypothetical protein
VINTAEYQGDQILWCNGWHVRKEIRFYGVMVGMSERRSDSMV